VICTHQIFGDQIKKKDIAEHVARVGDRRGFGGETWEAYT